MRFLSAVQGLISISLISGAMAVSGQTTAAFTQSPAPPSSTPAVSVYERVRMESWQWFEAPPESNTYSYAESLLRIGISQNLSRWDWELELSQPSVLGAPTDSISPITAQGQMGLGATYYASNGNSQYAAAAFLKQGYLRYHFGQDRNLRLGRFEFFEGQETRPKNANIAWLQTNRVAQRLVGNFGFSTAQRSFDGADGHIGGGSWDLAAMASRADQGVFNMNGNPELNVDLQYLAFTRSQFRNHLLWRAFALGYHDGRTGITRTDNRPLSIRQEDRNNIRIGTYGGDFIGSIAAPRGEFDFLGWGVLQNGQWGSLEQSSKAGTLEGGYQFLDVPSMPWVRAGYFYGSGDTNPADNRHQTFFQVLPTPWLYARFPFYNLMNNRDGFVQLIDHPSRRIDLRADVHSLQLASKEDLWYLGGGAYDNKVFGYTGRPANGHASLATVIDVGPSWQIDRNFTMNFDYAHASGKSTVASIYPRNHNAQFGFAELVYHWGETRKPVP